MAKSERLVVFLIFFSVLLSPLCTSSQQITLPAGPQYGRSSFHQLLWGKHYRKEWITPVTVSHFFLDTAMGGLKPYQGGGGRQSKTLRLHDTAGREYVLRSIDKTFGNALPKTFQKTFIEKLINDQVSLGHPYGAQAITGMAEAAKIFHTEPRVVYVPEQKALDSFNKDFSNQMYLFEQRPDENWETASNFGNAEKIISTDKLLENLLEDNDNAVDQLQYVRSRLLDMLIGDGSRHEDQWRWGKFKHDNKTIYKPIPRDRDQAFARFDGLLVRTILYMANIDHLQTFKDHIPNVTTNNFPSRNLDRRMANEVTKDQWIALAKEVQSLITDEVIERSVHQLPPEIFPISGNGMIEKLKTRRNDLEKYAEEYYTFLAKEVNIVGSEKDEFFQVVRLENGQTAVKVFKISKNGKISSDHNYSRVFNREETKEIRLYGIGGKDLFSLYGVSDEGILIRIIGGTGEDTIIDRSLVRKDGHMTHVYDDFDTYITRSKETKTHLSKDSAIHKYEYEEFRYNYQHLKPVLFYSFEDKFYAGLQLKIMRHGWRKEPYRSKQLFQVKYSFAQKAPSFNHQSDFIELFGKWSMSTEENYDPELWTNFFGLGNETSSEGDVKNFYQMRSKQLTAVVTLYRSFGKHVQLSVGPQYDMVQLTRDTNRYVYKNITGASKFYAAQHFAGLHGQFTYSHVDDRIVPTKGFYFTVGGQYLQNLKESKQLLKCDAQMQLFARLFKNMSLALRPTFAAVTGEPEFYQHVSIGGSNSLRGYSRDRFWGTSSFFSDNELQWLFIGGKFGVTGFYDIGRVWMKNESSSLWHTGYGGGIIAAPLHKFLASVTYGISNDGNHIHVRLYRSL